MNAGSSNKQEPRIIDYLTNGFVLTYGLAIVLGLAVFPLLKAFGVIH